MIRVMTVLAFVLALSVCSGQTLPQLTEADGVVLLGGQPLPHATISFHPTLSGLPANATATALTDDQGRFKLSVGGKPGAVPGENIVTVVEGPVPEDLRDPNAQTELTAFQAKRKNRPIPKQYANTNTSGVRVTVTKDQKEYKVELNR
jgi:hypothetical protein